MDITIYRMKILIAVLFLVLVVQIALFLVIRKRKKGMRSEDVLFKYDIRSRSDAWKLINDPSTPAKDRKELEKLYQEPE